MTDLFERDSLLLVDEIVRDVKKHLESLPETEADFYGYALLPGDFYTEVNAPTLTAAFQSGVRY